MLEGKHSFIPSNHGKSRKTKEKKMLYNQTRVAIVTGGSKGIGRAIAISMANAGIKVLICARGLSRLLDVQKEIQESGGEAVIVSADVTDYKNVKQVVDTAVQQFQKIDILVNNVGGAIRFGEFFELEDKDWHNSFNLNIMPIVYFVRETTSWLLKSTAPRIINISSISGIEPGLYNPHYTITRAAVINLSKYLSNIFASKGILVNVVCPGPIYTDSWERIIQDIANRKNITFDEAKKMFDKEEAAKIPLGRLGLGNDVAGLVTFLASEQANWITGSCFHVNGGKLRSMC